MAATRLKLENPAMARLALRLRTFWLLAHVHRLAPRMGRVDVSALSRQRVERGYRGAARVRAKLTVNRLLKSAA